MRYLAIPVSLLLLSACTVGPNYNGPPQVGSALSETGNGFVRGGDSALKQEPQLAAWWEGFNDPILNQLEQMAIAGSPDLDVARARLNQARASLRLEKVSGTPTIGAQAIYSHIRVPGLDLGGNEGEAATDGNSGSGGTNDYNLYNLGLQANWELDLFGGQRRKTEAASAKLDAANAAVADAQVSLTSAVAQAYLDLRDRQHRLDLGRAIAQQYQTQLELTQQRYELGTGSKVEVEQAQTALEQAQSDILSLQIEATSYANALAVLTGQVPGAVDSLVEPLTAIPLPPAQVAVGDPASLIRRRPDIRMAERQLAASNAQIGVAEAAQFPSLSFLGILGVGGTGISDLSNLDDFAAIALPRLTWNFLDFGRSRANIRQAKAATDEANANYRSTVLNALKDVEDSLTAFGHRREMVARLARAEQSSARAVSLTQQRFEAGTVSRLQVLDAQNQHLALRQSLVSAQAGLAESFVSVEKALGLGWKDENQK